MLKKEIVKTIEIWNVGKVIFIVVFIHSLEDVLLLYVPEDDDGLLEFVVNRWFAHSFRTLLQQHITVTRQLQPTTVQVRQMQQNVKIQLWRHELTISDDFEWSCALGFILTAAWQAWSSAPIMTLSLLKTSSMRDRYFSTTPNTASTNCTGVCNEKFRRRRSRSRLIVILELGSNVFSFYGAQAVECCFLDVTLEFLDELLDSVHVRWRQQAVHVAHV